MKNLPHDNPQQKRIKILLRTQSVRIFFLYPVLGFGVAEVFQPLKVELSTNVFWMVWGACVFVGILDLAMGFYWLKHILFKAISVEAISIYGLALCFLGKGFLVNLLFFSLPPGYFGFLCGLK